MDLAEAPALPSWLAESLPFRRKVARIGEHRIHFIDEGDGRPVFLIHGNPTWSFLWRKVIARLRGRKLRLIAPDLFGFGLSDKPRQLEAHSLDAHVATIQALVEGLDLRDAVVVGQDWGGPIGAGVAARTSGRFTAAVFGNTTFLSPRRPLRTTAFHRFSHVPVVSTLCFRGLGFPLPVLHRVQGDRASIGPFERRAYRYPLPRWADRAGILALARMVPSFDGHPSLSVLDEADRWAKGFDRPTALVWGLRDPILGRALNRLRQAMPHAHVTETQAGHFLQEEVPDALADAVLRVSGA